MSKETYMEIKRLTGEELNEILLELDNLFNLSAYSPISREILRT